MPHLRRPGRPPITTTWRRPARPCARRRPRRENGRASGRARRARAAWRNRTPPTGGRAGAADRSRSRRQPAGARPHHHDAVGERDRLLDVMGDEDQRRLGVRPQIEQMVLQIDAGEGVERRERLVEQQHLRPRHQRARDRDALRLAAGQLARPHIGLVGEADARQRLGDALRRSALGPVLEAEADIVGDRQPRQQPRLLEDDADLLVRRGDRRAVEHDRALASACRGRRPRAARSTCRSPSRRPPRRSRPARRRA